MPAPQENLDGFRLVHTDDFAGDAELGQFLSVYGATFAAYTLGWPDTSGHGYYDPAIVDVHDSVMSINLGGPLISGRARVCTIVPHVVPVQTYGRYAIRVRADTVAGYKLIPVLIWPVPNPPSPNTVGEFDHYEVNLGAQHATGFQHRLPATQGQFSVACDTTGWHELAVEWTPGLLEYFLDGVKVYSSKAGVMSAPAKWVIQCETELGGAPVPDPAAVGRVQVDWIAMWSYDPTARATKHEAIHPVIDNASASFTFTTVDPVTVTQSADQRTTVVTSPNPDGRQFVWDVI